MILLAACTDVQEATAKPLASSQEGTVVRDISIHSNILGRDMLYSVYLPAGYSSEKQSQCYTFCTARVAIRTSGGYMTIWLMKPTQ